MEEKCVKAIWEFGSKEVAYGWRVFLKLLLYAVLFRPYMKQRVSGRAVDGGLSNKVLLNY